MGAVVGVKIGAGKGDAGSLGGGGVVSGWYKELVVGVVMRRADIGD